MEDGAASAFEGRLWIVPYSSVACGCEAGQTPQMYLINTTLLDPMTYLLFGANESGELELLGSVAVV